MKILANVLCGLVAVLHVIFLVIEMFLWDHPFGRKLFSMTPEVSAASAVLAKNQGLYNGFLAAGIVWGLVSKRRDVLTFFLLCVIVAAIFGAATAKVTILFTQGLPAMLALIAVTVSARKADSGAN